MKTQHTPTSNAMKAALEVFTKLSKKGTGINSHMTELNGYMGDYPHRDIIRAVSEYDHLSNSHDMLVEVLLENQKVLLILRDASAHVATKEVLAALMDANSKALAAANGDA